MCTHSVCTSSKVSGKTSDYLSFSIETFVPIATRSDGTSREHSRLGTRMLPAFGEDYALPRIPTPAAGHIRAARRRTLFEKRKRTRRGSRAIATAGKRRGGT
jgi:hypothetical protein